MKYRIEFTGEQRSSPVNDRENLIRQLQLLEHGAVADIRKVYRSGVSDSVMERYKQYIGGRR